MSSGRLRGKGALLAGGASGIGAAQAIRFVEEGARVVIADLQVESGCELARRLGPAATFVRLDVRQEQAWTAAVAAAEVHLGAPLDILVNNAGVLREGSLEQTSLEDWRLTTEVMQTGVYLGMRAAAPSLRRARGGAIVNISSTAGMVAYANHFAYTAAKWAVRGMSKAAALDLAPDLIRVNSVHPGNTDTPMIAGKGYTGEEVPLKRNATAAEVAGLVLYLVSDEARYITGTEFVIDGGLTAS